MAGVPAAWFPDPTGRNEQRYWDGTVWTDHVARGGVQSTDVIAGDYAPPMRGATVPPMRRKKPKWPWVLGGIGAAFVVLVGGCAVIVSVAINSAVNTLNAEQRAHAISKQQFDAVPLGASQGDVIRTLGKPPENTQEFVNKGVLSAGDVNSSCIYYNKEGGGFGPRYQLCFQGDGLQSKNAY